MTGAMLLPEFDQEMDNTRKVLERIPAGSMDFRPHARSWTLRELAGHVANIPAWAHVTLGTTELDFAQPFPRPRLDTPADILALFDGERALSRAALEEATGDDLGVPWTLRAGEQVLFTMPRGAVLRTFVMNHVIHHRAQLTVYLRLLDVPVPGMYGPSADEAQ
ncbi:MAG TPA: DinB family protein [Longimicrobiales bacterium]|nr:DinB family protein [Longimicrobiales bacterium]